MTEAARKPLRMISLAISDMCELGRWLFERAGIEFREERHVPLLNFPATLTFLEPPILFWPGRRRWSSKLGLIVNVDANSPPGRKVFGEHAAERQRNQALLRAIVPPLSLMGHYCYPMILPLKKVMYPAASYGAPAWERAFLWWLYPVWRLVMSILFGKTAGARKSIETGMDLIEQELAARGGKPFLSGDEPAGIDVVVSALLSPVIFPPQYGGKLPDLRDTPKELQDFVARARARPAGRLVLETYARIR